MSRVEEYRAALRALPEADWAAYLTDRSGLPGPRGNIELGLAFAEEASSDQINSVIATGDEYLTFCGVVGLGRLLAEGTGTGARLRAHATDERWRVREAVAMALQRLGDADVSRMLTLATTWAGDTDPLVQRAALAGVCEPRLLHTPNASATAVDLCYQVTESLAARPSEERRRREVRTLRQALGYCWSVAVAADPARGLPRFEALDPTSDRDVAWIVAANRKKTRLAHLLAEPNPHARTTT